LRSTVAVAVFAATVFAIVAAYRCVEAAGFFSLMRVEPENSRIRNPTVQPSLLHVRENSICVPAENVLDGSTVCGNWMCLPVNTADINRTDGQRHRRNQDLLWGVLFFPEKVDDLF